MSRNDSRLGQMPEAPANLVPPSGINFTVPTEIVHLPSEGKFYPEGNSMHGRTSVEVRYMTAREEDILASPSLIKEGLAIERLLESVIVDKNIKISDMLLIDRNALMLAARITGYGTELKTLVDCQYCGWQNSHSFDLSKIELEQAPDLKDLEVEQDGPLFFFDLPVSNVRVGIRPLFVADEKYLDSLQEKQRKLNLPPSRLTDALRLIIVSINGDTSDSNKNRFIDVMPAQDSRRLRSIYKLVIPQLNTEQIVECESCKRESDVEVPFNTDFFWPGE